MMRRSGFSAFAIVTLLALGAGTVLAARSLSSPMIPLLDPNQPGSMMGGMMSGGMGQMMGGMMQNGGMMGSGAGLRMRNGMDARSMSMGDMMDALRNATGEDFDQTFLSLMIPHHQGAVHMAQMIKNRAVHPEVRTLAQNIITSQQKEIRQMRQWQQQWGGQSAVRGLSWMRMMMGMMPMSGSTMMMPGMQMSLPGGGMGMMGMRMGMMSGSGMSMMMGNQQTDAMDLHFIDMMISHHQSGIDMAQLVLTKAVHPELKQLAQQIITAQQAEIDQMKQWRKEWTMNNGQ